jgi:hypothetical protein
VFRVHLAPYSFSWVVIAVCGTGALCDPRGIGLNPVVNQIWSKYMPLPNDPQYSGGDQYNTQGYLTNVALPIKSDFGVVRIDHDFGEKNHFTSSYRYYKFNQLTSDQVDIGGLEPGDVLGQATATSVRPQEPWYYVAGLTSTLTPNLTNDVHFSYLRNYWQWSTLGGTPQLPGLGGAVEIGGESANALIPVNVNTSNTRQRLWDGQDQGYRDDVSWLRGNHLFQFGGSIQRNHDYTQRNDNGVNIDTSTVYQLTNGTGIAFPSAYTPAGLPASQLSNYENLYTEVLGLVAVSQNEYTRSGSALSLNALGTTDSNTVVLPSYTTYASDTWHFRPTLTLTYGLSYSIDMPPSSGTGNQLVYSNGTPVGAASYLAQRESAALAGQSYDPILGFETLGASHRNYLFNPFYGGVSPRVALAWNPKFTSGLLGDVFGDGKTVIRGGYSRIYGRLNGIRTAFTPLLGAGSQQAVQCIGPTDTGTCTGTGGATPATAFRIGTDGLAAPLPAVSQTLSQPYLPGIDGNAAAADGNLVDPNFRPNRSDEFNFTIQRAITPKISIEAGYIGRIIRNEFQLINLNAVPTMTTLNGQSFANAFADVYQEVSANQVVQSQPFFEAALGGPTSSYCRAYSSCTAAVASLQKSTITSTQVFNLWSALNSAPSWTLGRTLLSTAGAAGSGIGSQLQAFELSTSLGYGNYNAAFVTFNIRDWHGLTTHSNFTWSRAMGTGSEAQSASGFSVVDPWNLHESYGPQPFDIRFIYSLVELYQLPFFKEQRGIAGHLLGGWSIAPIFTAQSGAPLEVSIGTGSNTDAQSFGEFYGGGNTAFENAVLTTAYTGGNSAHTNVVVASGAGVNGNAANGGSGMNMFANPNAIFSEFRPLILGLDTSAGGAGVIRGLPTWNLDATISKDVRIVERLHASLLIQFTNILNHFQPANPTLNIDSPQTWGVISSQANTPRQVEFGLRASF